MSDYQDSYKQHESDLNLENALECMQDIGKKIEVIVRDEDNITRSKYRSIQKKEQKTKFSIWCYPIIFSPGTYKLEKAGIRQEVDCLLTTAAKSWINAGYDFSDIDNIRFTVKIDKESYEIKEATKDKQCMGVFLYWNLGLFKK